MYTTDNFTPPTTLDSFSGSDAAARLLELAVNNADQLMAETKAEAAALVATAHAEADQLTASARVGAEQVTLDAHSEARRVREDVEQFRAGQAAELLAERDAQLTHIAEEKAALEAAVRHLQELEHAYQERMRSFLASQLDQLDALGRNEDTQLESVPTEDAA
jgi:FtsZ-binding cell division protein ZapB